MAAEGARRSAWSGPLPSALGWIALLAVASRWDLALSRAVVQPQDFFGLLIARHGEGPGVALALWAAYRWAAQRWWPAPSTALSEQPAVPPPQHALWGAIVLSTLLYPALVVQVIKVLWGRTRFIRLRPDFADYTPFYRPRGPGTGRSFPSGHVAIAGAGTPLPAYLRLRGRICAARWSWLATRCFMFAVAWGRIRVGAHYLSDTIVSLGTMSLLGPAMLRMTPRGAPGRHTAAQPSKGERGPRA